MQKDRPSLIIFSSLIKIIFSGMSYVVPHRIGLAKEWVDIVLWLLLSRKMVKWPSSPSWCQDVGVSEWCFDFGPSGSEVEWTMSNNNNITYNYKLVSRNNCRLQRHFVQEEVGKWKLSVIGIWEMGTLPHYTEILLRLEEMGEEEFIQQLTGMFFPPNIVIITNRHGFVLSRRWELTQEFI